MEKDSIFLQIVYHKNAELVWNNYLETKEKSEMLTDFCYCRTALFFITDGLCIFILQGLFWVTFECYS